MRRNDSFEDHDTWWTTVIKRWGMVDHESALSFFLDKLYRARRDWEERTAGRFSHSANIRADTIYALQRVFAGWARSDSKAAWEHFLDLESEHRKMGLFPEIIGNSGPMPAEMTRSLAKDHPEFAFSEFQRAGRPQPRSRRRVTTFSSGRACGRIAG